LINDRAPRIAFAKSVDPRKARKRPPRKVLDVAVNVRVGSLYFGQHVAVELSEENRRQLCVPRDFDHGFAFQYDTADLFYKCDNAYNPRTSFLGMIQQSGAVENPSLSARNAAALTWPMSKSSRVWSDMKRILLTGTNGQVLVAETSSTLFVLAKPIGRALRQ